MHTFVIFGASGDLTSRKLIPALFRMHQKGRLPEKTRVVGFSRTHYTHEAWRDELRASTAEHAAEHFTEEAWKAFSEQVYYSAGDIGKLEDFNKLAACLNEREEGAESTRVYYLATAPRFYETAVAMLGAAGMAEESHGPRRVVIEKPFGVDLKSAHALNDAVHQVFNEHQVYRIDHYLGKETVQNLLVLRFANSIFEPVWNRNYIDHVQITVAEKVPVGTRAGYYDTAGVLRDMFQNHLLQLLTITAMEAPARFAANQVRDEKVKVLRSIRPMSPADIATHTIRGQYDGYLNEPDVPPNSQTATFAAMQLWIDNWRWQGVPFYLRSGKLMSCRTTQIVIQFREPPHILFDGAPWHSIDANRLIIQVQPAEGIQLQFVSKVPDAGMRLRMQNLEYRFASEYRGVMPEAYERLLLDALQGDASLFARADEVELAWGIIDPVDAAWQSATAPPLAGYEPGFWGPNSCTEWMQAQGRQWFDACPVLDH